MRDFAMKGIREEHLLRCAELVRDHGMKRLKLYMVFGYPGETMEDIDEMIELLDEISSICDVALGMSPLVAKKNTPLDGSPFESRKSLKKKIKRVHQGLRGKVDIRSTSARWAWIEYQIAQGGFDMADAAEQAWREGANFSAWKRAINKFQKNHIPLAKPGNRLQSGAMLPDDLTPSRMR